MSIKIKFARTSATEISELIIDTDCASTVAEVLDDVNEQYNTELSSDDVSALDDTYIESLTASCKAAMLIDDISCITLSVTMPAQIKAAQEAQAQSTAAASAAVPHYVSVEYGAGIGAAQNIVIIPGVTTVQDVLFSQTVQTMTGKTINDLRTCRVTIAGATASLATTLSAGERMRIQERVAGDKGADGVVINDADGNLIGVFELPADSVTCADLLQELDFQLWLDASGYGYPDGVDASDVLSIEGMTDNLPLLIDRMNLFNGARIVLNIEKQVPQASTTTTTVTTYTCTISQGAGINPVTVPFAVGATVQDVIFDPTVLARLHQSREDVSRCDVTINGTRCVMTSELEDNDQVRIVPRVAGDKGNGC